MKARYNHLLASLIATGSAGLLHADSASWTGSTDGNWSDTGNWSGPPAGVPSVAGDIATFDGAGNGNTAITGIPTLTLNEIYFDGAATAAYTFTNNNITWSIPAEGGITVTDTVTTNQDLSGIQFFRPAVNTTANFSNQAANTTLKLPTIFSGNNGGTTVTQARLRFAPAADAIIEIPSNEVLDNSGTGGAKKMSVLLDDEGTLKIAGTGSYNGTDVEGNSLTIHRGTLIPTLVIPASATKSSLGTGGRIQLGQAGQAYTATLRYELATSPTTDRPFHIIDGNTGVFDITDALSTMELTGAITASGTANGGGNLTKKGLGALKISGAANTYNGITRIEAGTLILGNLLAIQNSAYDTSSPGTLDLSLLVGNPTFGGLTSSTDYDLPSNLTLSPPSGRSVTFSGSLGESSPILELTKSGSGTQVLSGDNTFTGNVTVSVGRLTLAHSNALGLADPNPPYNGRKGLISQGGSRSIGLTGGITIPSNIDIFASSNSFDGGGIENISGDNEIQSSIRFSVGLPALNISSTSDTLTVSGDISMTQTARTLHLGGASVADNTISGNIAEETFDVNGDPVPNPAIMPLIKQGVGKWILSGTNTYKGDTTVNGGTLVLANGGSQRFLPQANATSNKITGNGSAITLDGALDIDLTSAAGAPDGTDWLIVDVANLAEIYGTNFTVTGFTETALDSGVWEKTVGARKYTFTQSSGLLEGDAAGSPFQTWAAANITAIDAGADATATGDPDNDGTDNLAEFALAGDPLDGSDNGLTRFGIEDVSGTDHLTLTFACRSAAAFTGAGPASVSQDGVTYTVRATTDLGTFTLALGEVTAIPGDLPAAPSGYTYRTFRVVDTVGANPKAFIQLQTTATP
jgi:autotransporter-associated beta strand protein